LMTATIRNITASTMMIFLMLNAMTVNAPRIPSPPDPSGVKKKSEIQNPQTNSSSLSFPLLDQPILIPRTLGLSSNESAAYPRGIEKNTANMKISMRVIIYEKKFSPVYRYSTKNANILQIMFLLLSYFFLYSSYNLFSMTRI
jgi:hypothetical protein